MYAFTLCCLCHGALNEVREDWMFGNNFNRPVHLEDCGRLFFDCVLQGGDQLLQLGCSCLLGSETLLDFTFEPLKHILVVLEMNIVIKK